MEIVATFIRQSKSFRSPSEKTKIPTKYQRETKVMRKLGGKELPVYGLRQKAIVAVPEQPIEPPRS